MHAMGGTWSPVILFENSVDPASVGDVRHPASGLAQCRLALLTPECSIRGLKSLQSGQIKNRPRGSVFNLAGMEGLGHVPRPRDFTIAN